MNERLAQSLIGRWLFSRYQAPWAERQGWGGEWSPSNPKRNGLEPATPLGHLKSVGLDGIHPGVLRSTQESSPSHFQLSTRRSGQPGRPGGWKSASVTPIYKKGWRRSWGTPGLLVWARCQGRSWITSSWVTPHSTWRTTQGSGPANMGS